MLNGWALDGVWKVQSGPPLTVETFYDTPWFYGYAIAEPVPGTNPWFANPIQPAGKQLNPWGFEAPTDPSTTFKYRNSLYSPYGIDQVDFALRRRFSITERFKLDFRAELFNIFNHPMFYICLLYTSEAHLPGLGTAGREHWAGAQPGVPDFRRQDAEALGVEGQRCPVAERDRFRIRHP